MEQLRWSLLLMLLGGCAHWMQLEQSTAGPSDFPILPKPIQPRAQIVQADYILNGQPQPLAFTTFMELFQAQLIQAHLFAVVQGPSQPVQGGCQIKVTLQVHTDYHSWENFCKGLMIGTTMGLLAPWLACKASLRMEMITKVRLPSGDCQTYHVHSRGQVYYQLLANPSPSWTELHGQVLLQVVNRSVARIIKLIDNPGARVSHPTRGVLVALPWASWRPAVSRNTFP